MFSSATRHGIHMYPSFCKGSLHWKKTLDSLVMNWTSPTNDKFGLLAALDFRKTFDSLEWPLMETVNSFNFGKGIRRRWISSFYTNAGCQVTNDT